MVSARALPGLPRVRARAGVERAGARAGARATFRTPVLVDAPGVR
ncbi:hypothetical protein STTU_2424 [Streptomyces sp. Tu6071]|nr:hypothetical protein STTU_2424 [Streptomyces sp. Tu6071]